LKHFLEVLQKLPSANQKKHKFLTAQIKFGYDTKMHNEFLPKVQFHVLATATVCSRSVSWNATWKNGTSSGQVLGKIYIQGRMIIILQHPNNMYIHNKNSLYSYIP
jgi:hypothetical protein